MVKGTEKKTVKIEGMHCASCVASVEKSLKKVPGVVTAVVNLATESASVEYQPERATGTDLKKRWRTPGSAWWKPPYPPGRIPWPGMTEG